MERTILLIPRQPGKRTLLAKLLELVQGTTKMSEKEKGTEVKEPEVTTVTQNGHTWHLATPRHRQNPKAYFHHLTHIVTEEINEVIVELTGAMGTLDRNTRNEFINKFATEYGDLVGVLKMYRCVDKTDPDKYEPMCPEWKRVELEVDRLLGQYRGVTFATTAIDTIAALAAAGKAICKVGRFGPDEPPFKETITGWDAARGLILHAIAMVEVTLRCAGRQPPYYNASALIIKRNNVDRMMYVAQARGMFDH